MIESIIDSLINITILLVMLSMGLGMTFKQVTFLWKKPSELFKALLSAIIIIPFVAYIILSISERVFDIPNEVFVGIMIISAAAGNVIAVKFSEKFGTKLKDATSLMITLAIASIFSTPIVVSLAFPESSISAVEVFKVVLISLLLPIIVGLSIRTWGFKFADKITNPITKVSGLMLNVVIVLIILKDIDTIIGFGVAVITLMFLLNFINVFIGHVIGGKKLAEKGLLGLSSAMRSGAIALMVATQVFDEAVPVTIAFSVISIVVGLMYVKLFSEKKVIVRVKK